MLKEPSSILVLGGIFLHENFGIPRVDVYYAPNTRVAVCFDSVSCAPIYKEVMCWFIRSKRLLWWSNGMSSLWVVFLCQKWGGIHVGGDCGPIWDISYLLMIIHCSTVYASPLYKVFWSKSLQIRRNSIFSLGWVVFSCQKWGGINVMVIMHSGLVCRLSLMIGIVERRECVQ